MNYHQDTPELSFGKVDIPSILEKVILGGIVFILVLPILGDYGTWLFPIGRDVIFKMTVEFLLLLVFVIWSFGHLKLIKNWKLEIRNLKTSLILSMLLFWLIMILATLNSVQPEFSLWGNIYKNQGLMTWTHYLLFFFLLILFLRGKNHWNFLIHIAIFVGTLVGLVALWQIAQHGVGSRVASATLNNSNYLAAYLVLLIPITFSFFLKKHSHILGIASIIQFLALLGTQTRGAYVGVIAAGIVFAILYLAHTKRVPKLKLFFWTAVPLFALLAAFYLLLNTNTGQSFQKKLPDSTDRFLDTKSILNSVAPRLEAWRAGGKGMLTRPFLGYGPENFFVAFDEHYSGSQDHLGSLAEEGSLSESWFDKAHNFIFDVGATTGFLGLFAYVGIFASALYLLSRKLSIVKIGFISALAGYFTQNLLGFDTIVPGIYLMFLLGYAHYSCNSPPIPPSLTLREGGAPPRIFLLCIALISISLFTISINLHTDILRANHQLNLAESLAQNVGVEQAFAAFEKGLEYNAPPVNPNLRRRYAVIALAYHDEINKRCNVTGSDPVTLSVEQCSRLSIDSKKYLNRALILQQENAAREWPRFTRNYIYAAQISHILGDYKKSDFYFEKALELSPHRTSINAEWTRLREETKGAKK